MAVAEGRCQSSVAIVRPPGHHAEPNKSMGFCFFNNVAVAAKAILHKTAMRRILIVDWWVDGINTFGQRNLHLTVYVLGMFIMVGLCRENTRRAPVFTSTFRSPSLASKVTVFRPLLKRIPMCYIYPYTGMRTRPSTLMIPLEAIPREEKVEDLACVYLSRSPSPVRAGSSERSGGHTVLMSHNALFLPGQFG